MEAVRIKIRASKTSRETVVRSRIATGHDTLDPVTSLKAWKQLCVDSNTPQDREAFVSLLGDVLTHRMVEQVLRAAGSAVYGNN